MQGTAEAITDQQFANLVQNTPFQGSTCLHQNVGSPGSPLYVCVVTSDLCTNSSSATPSRGILYHRYDLDENGLIVTAKIVPPTSQNQKRI